MKCFGRKDDQEIFSVLVYLIPVLNYPSDLLSSVYIMLHQKSKRNKISFCHGHFYLTFLLFITGVSLEIIAEFAQEYFLEILLMSIQKFQTL